MLSVLVAGAALIIAATLGALALNARGASNTSDADAATSSGGTAARRSAAPLALPLDAVDAGFDATVTAVDPAEGPEAMSYCNNVPQTDGLVDWAGDVMTENDGRRRVVQVLSRFRSSVDAAAYVSSNATIVDCEEWETPGTDGTIVFTVAEASPSTIVGDETRRFDLTATTDGPDLFLRVLLARSGRDVVQVTYVSANRQDLDDAERLVNVVGEKSGF
ncbi:MAG: hypothetical protein ACR2QO_26205 [Acidimicrobiales bacterium]